MLDVRALKQGSLVGLDRPRYPAKVQRDTHLTAHAIKSIRSHHLGNAEQHVIETECGRFFAAEQLIALAQGRRRPCKSCAAAMEEANGGE